MTVLYLSIFALALTLSFALTRYVRNFATNRGWVSPPLSERHLHSAPLPRLGGVAIFAAFLLSLGTALAIAAYYPSVRFGFSVKILTTLLVPACLVFLLGLYDDVRGLGPYVKFSVQGVAATILWLGGFRILDLPVLFGSRQFPWFIGLALTIVWVLGITNAFNLIDGLDGLAAGSAMFSTLVVFVVALLSQSSLVALMTVALTGAILGFLRFNFNPATIFLGDSGSLFIGFLLSALALEGAQKAPTVIAVAIPVVSFGLPILETSLSVLRRLIGGRPVFTADREHIHHKLLQLGLSHREVVIVLYAVSALFGLLSLFLLWPTGSSLGLVLAVLGTGIWLGVQHLGYPEFGEIRRVAQRTLEQRQIVINNLAIRRATAELRAARNYDQICRILTAAFSSNDFDAFDLNVKLQPSEYPVLQSLQLVPVSHGEIHFRWNRPGTHVLPGSSGSWSVTLNLVTTSNRRRGSLSVQRLYHEEALHLDVNLLICEFPVVLADALDRVIAAATESVPKSAQESSLVESQVEAQAG